MMRELEPQKQRKDKGGPRAEPSREERKQASSNPFLMPGGTKHGKSDRTRLEVPSKMVP